MDLEYKLPLTKDTLLIKSLTTGYSNKKQKRIVSKNLNLSIKNGELVALIGPNGCGKSTLMRTISALQNKITGEVFINSNPVHQLKAKQKALLLSLVLTEKVEAINLTVWDIIAVGRYPYVGRMGMLTDTDKEVINTALKQCSLLGFDNRLFSELSDGEKQRVMIARALAQDTPLMILDEPTAHLDLPNRIDMMCMLSNLSKKTDKAILVSTHELDLAMQWADTIWLMNKDGVIFKGSPEDLVLSQELSTVFNNKHASFDMETGLFKMNRKSVDEICLTGDGEKYIWTCRALARQGFTITENPNATIQVVINENNWELKHTNKTQSFNSIAALIASLQTPKYWHKVITEL